jgi:hypothetical protein
VIDGCASGSDHRVGLEITTYVSESHVRAFVRSNAPLQPPARRSEAEAGRSPGSDGWSNSRNTNCGPVASCPLTD